MEGKTDGWEGGRKRMVNGQGKTDGRNEVENQDTKKRRREGERN